MKKQLVSMVMIMSLAMITLNTDVYAIETTSGSALSVTTGSGIVMEEEDTDTSFVDGYEEDTTNEEEPLKIIGAKGLEVNKGDKIDLLEGVSTNKEATLSVSEYDEKLYNKRQSVEITARTPDGEETSCIVILVIRGFKVKSTKKFVYATITTNVRAKPTSKSKKLGTVRFNQKIRVTGKVYQNKLIQKDETNKWYKIKYKGKTAYITTKYSVSKKIKKNSVQWTSVKLNKSAVASGWFNRDGDHLNSETWDKATEEWVD